MSEPERIQTPYLAEEDDFELTLRPRRLDEFIGQVQLKEQLAVAIEAASARGDALDHVLGIRAQVTLVEPLTIQRSEGKARRVIDRRTVQA